MRILIAEDERDLNQLIKKRLKDAGYSVDACFDGEEVFDYLLCAEYDALVLDIMMPKMDGITVLKKLRREGNTLPVLLLTARDRIEDRVTGLDAGADDYLVKPFAFEELLARLRPAEKAGYGKKQYFKRGGSIPPCGYPPGIPGGQGASAFLQGVFPASLHDAECRRRVKPG